MRICILEGSYENSEAPFKDYDTKFVILPYLQEHECEEHVIEKKTAIKQVRELVKKGFDVFINLCDGAWEEDRPGIEVVQALERLDVPFTGATSSFYEPTREVMKLVCRYWDVKTPAWVFAENVEDIEYAVKTLHFPLIVKHPNSYSSIGIVKASRVETEAQLRTQVLRTINAYGSALVEEFIEGREFSVLVVENVDDPLNPFIYDPVEFLFPKDESFKHFDLKWIDYKQMDCIPCKDQLLGEKLKDISRNLFIGLNGTGYGRCDIRMNAEGVLYMLEINPNCAVFGPLDEPGTADLILMNDPLGHKGFAERIIEMAIKSNQKKKRKWKSLLDTKNHYGMYAAQDIEAGEVIEPFEEQPHNLVSKTQVQKTWNELKKKWFAEYAYPLTDEIWVIWSSDPANWKPINHSCDPNAWLEGLNLVARRNIPKDEEITIDYATFCCEEMIEFTCNCGSPLCRHTIRGTDYLQPFVERYGDHVSDYVRTKRRQL